MKDSNSKISINRQKKEAIVAELLQKVEKAKGIVFTNYQGLTHQQIENLKKALKSLEAEYVNTKNTLLLIALKKAGSIRQAQDESVKGKGESDNNDLTLNASPFTLDNPTATLFIYDDIVGPLKQLTKTLKEFSLPTIKFGILGGIVMTNQEIVKISTLAPLPELRAQLLGVMNGPVSGLHRALNWNITKLVLTLKAVEAKKA